MKKFKFGKAFNLDPIKSFQYKHTFKTNKNDSLDSWQDSLMGNFGESVSPKESVSQWRVMAIILILTLAFLSLFARLFHLQITQGGRNRSLADSNRIQVKVIHAPRGVIYDRNGKILARNEPGFRLVESSASGQTHSSLLSRDEALSLEVRNDPKLKDLEIDNLRFYPYKEKTSHIIGYTSEITKEEFERENANKALHKVYRLGDRVGRGGVEQIYENILRGTDGGEVIEIDATGNRLRTITATEPIPGQNLYLTIDSSLQEIAYQSLQKAINDKKVCCGVAIVMDPKSGQILSLVSIPGFNPANLNESLKGLNSPLLNRSIAGLYPPGSTFKIATALAGLSSGKITPLTQFEDTGIMYLGPFSFSNWYYTQYGRKEQGPVDVKIALKRSNDIFFYHLGQLTGEKIMGDTAKRLNFGQKLGIDLPNEEAGLIPDNDWKQNNFGEPWYPGDSLHMAIGQGYVLTTPLQIAGMTGIIAADGQFYQPHLAWKLTSPGGKILKEYNYDPQKLNFNQNDINLVKEGLESVPKAGGTAYPFFNFPIQTAGKTGTAEFGDPKDSTHAWYTSYGPVDDPKIVVTVLVEAGGEGSGVAAPVAKEIFRWYFSSDKANLIKDINAPIASQSAQPVGD